MPATMELYEGILFLIIMLFVWLICGFVGFLIEAKMHGFKKFDKETRSEFVACLMLGVLSLLYMSYCALREWFIDLMDELLKTLNK